MTTICCSLVMLPAARMICSRSIRFMISAIDFPAFLRGQDAAEWIALPQSPACFRFIEQHRANFLPRPFEDFEPFADGRHRAVLKPALTSRLGPGQSGAIRIAVNPPHNYFGHRQAAFVNSLVRLHE